MWDVGGQKKLRQLWHHYYNNVDAVIYVVDSCDRERLEEAQEELHHLMTAPELEKSALLVLANKQDLPGSLGVSEIADHLKLQTMRNRKWYAQSTCATTG